MRYPSNRCVNTTIVTAKFVAAVRGANTESSHRKWTENRFVHFGRRRWAQRGEMCAERYVPGAEGVQCESWLWIANQRCTCTSVQFPRSDVLDWRAAGSTGWPSFGRTMFIGDIKWVAVALIFWSIHSFILFRTGHSNQAYIVPVLFLGTTLGCPLLPLTIESQDFVSAFQTTGEGSPERQLLERWYILDANAEPPCYRLRTTNITTANDETAIDLQQLYKTLVDIFTKELRDSYLTTVIEQEINNTVLISQELSKRCIWIHTGPLPSKCTDADGIESVANEMCRRLTNIQLELKNQLCEKHLIRIPPTIQVPLAASLKSLLTANIDSICDDHANKFQIPHCTYGVDRNLLAEIEAVNQNSNLLSQNCANFAIMDKIKQ